MDDLPVLPEFGGLDVQNQFSSTVAGHPGRFAALADEHVAFASAALAATTALERKPVAERRLLFAAVVSANERFLRVAGSTRCDASACRQRPGDSWYPGPPGALGRRRRTQPCGWSKPRLMLIDSNVTLE